MEDEAIVDLYWQRSERAIQETDEKYGPYCRSISFRILSDKEDAEECVSDTFLTLWNRLPPERPRSLRAFAAAVTRNLSLKRMRGRTAQKRGGELQTALEELDEVLSSPISVEREVENRELIGEIERFLHTLSRDDRIIFMGRYWLFAPVAEIAQRLGCTQGRVKTSLYRSRQKLQEHLKKEGLL